MSRALKNRLVAVCYQGFSAVAHTNGAAFTHSNHDVIDSILLADDAPNHIREHFNSFIGKTVADWENTGTKKDA